MPRKPELTELEIRLFLLERRLHETAQDARQASAELDASIARYGGSVSRHFKRVVREHDSELTDTAKGIRAKLDETMTTLEDTINKMLGARDSGELLDQLTLRLAIVMRPVVADACARAANVGAFRKIVSEELKNVVSETMVAPNSNLSSTRVGVLRIPVSSDLNEAIAEWLQGDDK